MNFRNKKLKYQLVSNGIMNAQINLRLPEKLLGSARKYADKHGYATLQEFIKETLREKLFDKAQISKKELALVSKFLKVCEDKGLYGTEKELFNELDRS